MYNFDQIFMIFYFYIFQILMILSYLDHSLNVGLRVLEVLKFDAYVTMNLLHLSIPFISVFD